MMKDTQNKNDDLRSGIPSLFTCPPCFIGVFFLIGLLIFGLDIDSAYYGRASRSWPTVNGHIFQCQVNEEHNKNRYGHDYTTWRVKVEYSYIVDEKPFTSSRRSFGSDSSSFREVQQEICNNLKKGSSVTVHYQPSNPSNAVLVAGNDGRDIYNIVFGIVFVSVAACPFLSIIRKLRLSAKQDNHCNRISTPQRTVILSSSSQSDFQKKHEYSKLDTSQSTVSLLCFTCQVGIASIIMLICAIIIAVGSTPAYDWLEKFPDCNVYAWLKQEYRSSLGEKALSWPIVNGRLLECKLTEENNSENNPTAWQITAQYSYVVNQKTFTGSRLSFGDNNSGSHEKQQQLCNRLSDGVAVHYQPDNPSNSVLFIGGHNKYPPLDIIMILRFLALLVAAAAIIECILYIFKLLAISRRITATNKTRPCLYNLCIAGGILLLIVYIGFSNTCMLLFFGGFISLIIWFNYQLS